MTRTSTYMSYLIILNVYLNEFSLHFSVRKNQMCYRIKEKNLFVKIIISFFYPNVSFLSAI